MRRVATMLIGTALGIAGCGGSDSVGGLGGTFSPTGLPGSQGNNTQIGFLDTGLPEGWSYLPGQRKSFGEGPDCRAAGACGFGGQTRTNYATFANGGAPIIFVSTKRFSDTELVGGSPAVAFELRTSAIQRDAFALTTPNSGRRLRLSFDFAFLLGRDVAGDSAVVQIVGPDNAPVRLFRVLRSEVGTSIAARAGDCGRSGFGTTASQYESASQATPFIQCTDWTTRTADVSAYRGQNVRLRFLTGEAGADITKGNTFLIRNLEIQEEQ
jgi:hypothetical protein